MTREEAIARIKDHKVVHKMNEPRAIYISQALDMAIQALEQNESAEEWYKLFVEKLDEQEPCDDAVSREAVLAKKIYTETEEGWSGYTVNADYIEQLPSVTQKSGKWIPVSERLPETKYDVLATDGVDMFVAWYSKDRWQGWMSSDNNFERNTPIEAWMPLPKPYKAESEE